MRVKHTFGCTIAATHWQAGAPGRPQTVLVKPHACRLTLAAHTRTLLPDPCKLAETGDHDAEQEDAHGEVNATVMAPYDAWQPYFYKR
jgi:hypothetical protein